MTRRRPGQPRLVSWKLADLRPLDYNPRRIDDAARKNLAASLSRFGLVEPIVVNTHEGRRGNIVGGFQRWALLLERGEVTAGVIEVDLDETRERELNIRLNARGGDWDYERMAEEFEGEQLGEWGLTAEELKEFDAAVKAHAKAAAGEDEEEGEEEPEEARVVEPGDVLVFSGERGEHRLYCADSTGEAGLALAGEPLLMIFDPPFDLDYSAWSVPESARVLMVWGRGARRLPFEAGLVPGWSSYDEVVFTGQARGIGNRIKHVACCVHDLCTVWRRGKACGFDTALLLAAGAKVSEDGRPHSVQASGLVRSEMGHGKGLLSMAVGLSCVPAGSAVWDPCAGSGSALIAAEQHGRLWRGAELLPKWAELIGRRWCKVVGRPAVLERGESRRTFRLDSGGGAELAGEGGKQAKGGSASRPSAAMRGYGHQHRRRRAAVLAKEPLCRLCAEEGRETPATEVDHIDGDPWNNDQANLRPLCKPHHDRRTYRDQAFGRPRRPTIFSDRKSRCYSELRVATA